MRSQNAAPAPHGDKESGSSVLRRVLDGLIAKLKAREGESPKNSGLFDELIKAKIGDEKA